MNAPEAGEAGRTWPPPEVEGVCTTGKLRYPSADVASEALARVRGLRTMRGNKADVERAPERAYYLCSYCHGWHLTSQAMPLPDPEPEQWNGEPLIDYARRLERRIKEQRDQLEAINALRDDAANRGERKRIQFLTMALGRTAELLEREREAKRGLIRKLGELAAENERMRREAQKE